MSKFKTKDLAKLGAAVAAAGAGAAPVSSTVTSYATPFTVIV